MRTLQSEALEGKFLPLRGVKMPTWIEVPENILDEIIKNLLEQNRRVLASKK